MIMHLGFFGGGGSSGVSTIIYGAGGMYNVEYLLTLLKPGLIIFEVVIIWVLNFCFVSIVLLHLSYPFM
jgi:hypothetical protein